MDIYSNIYIYIWLNRHFMDTTPFSKRPMKVLKATHIALIMIGVVVTVIDTLTTNTHHLCIFSEL